MSLATSAGGHAGSLASAAARQVVASYPTYEQAERAVDRLSDSGFPVEQSAIVGRDLRLVEQVVGRLTKARAALMGAASGAWFGLFVGAILGLFLPGPEWVVLRMMKLQQLIKDRRGHWPDRAIGPTVPDGI